MTAQPQSTLEPRHIGVLLLDDVEGLDAVGPWEVVAAWTHFHPQDGWAVFHPGGIGTRPMLPNDKHLERVGEQRRQVPLLTRVCSDVQPYVQGQQGPYPLAARRAVAS